MQDALKSQVNRVENYTAVFLIFLIAINFVVALLFSRSATHPLRALASAFNQHLSQLKEHFRIQQALNVAMEIQQTLLPLEPPRIDGLDIYGMTRYCEKIGGDYFDYLCVGEKSQQRLFVAVGDVSGHGIPPALLMATVRALLRYRTDAAGSIGKIITDVNRKFNEDVENSGRFFTLFLTRIDLKQHRIEWVRAGHDPALLYDPEEDTFRSLRGDGIPLGIDPGYAYQESDFSVRAGQILFIGTDGV
jgi:sigma-B regulation protein RsbU (phosphoserine phosphatase)